MKNKIQSVLFLSGIGVLSLFATPIQALTTYCDTHGNCVPTYTLAPCSNNPSDACSVLAAFDNKQSDHWTTTFNADGSVYSTSGIPNTPFYTSANGVAQGVLHTNNSNSPGLAVLVNVVGTAISVSAGPNSNSAGRGYCNPVSNANFNFTATPGFRSNGPSFASYVFVGTGYSCPNF